MGGGFNPMSMVGDLMGGIGKLAQTFAPLANLVLPGIGPMIAQVAGGVLQGAGNFMSKMDTEKLAQKGLDAKEAFNNQAAKNDMAAAEGALSMFA